MNSRQAVLRPRLLVDLFQLSRKGEANRQSYFGERVGLSFYQALERSASGPGSVLASWLVSCCVCSFLHWSSAFRLPSWLSIPTSILRLFESRELKARPQIVKTKRRPYRSKDSQTRRLGGLGSALMKQIVPNSSPVVVDQSFTLRSQLPTPSRSVPGTSAPLKPLIEKSGCKW